MIESMSEKRLLWMSERVNEREHLKRRTGAERYKCSTVVTHRLRVNRRHQIKHKVTHNILMIRHCDDCHTNQERCCCCCCPSHIFMKIRNVVVYYLLQNIHIIIHTHIIYTHNNKNCESSCNNVIHTKVVYERHIILSSVVVVIGPVFANPLHLTHNPP